MVRKKINSLQLKPHVKFFLLRRLLFLLILCIGIVIIICLLLVTSFRLSAMIRESKSAHDAAPQTGRFVQAADLEVFVQEAGPPSGQAIVFIHGTGAWSESWRETINVLADQGFRTVAIDLPPFGFSEKREGVHYKRTDQAKRIIGVLDSLHISSTILVGHSFGSGPTVEAAMMVPERVHSLILIDAALGLQAKNADQTSQPSFATKILSIRPVRNTVVATTLTNPLLSKYLLTQFIALDEAATPDRVTMFQKPFVVKNSTIAVADWVHDFYGPEERSLSTEVRNYANLSMPVLIVWGDLDTVTPIEQGEHLSGIIPGSELIVLRGVGHIPQIENAELFNKALLSFIIR